ncbi:DCD (Development and Cell Death) domain protein [Rhynchospora pubera]|uniref:DCD (Development and Cell Death) domain protein n=1 Tax=Rhynchospora pubera TaxID=906938 RepID=A0AAV8FEN9_9POAL|nr:DCD (Development and Cell Death) domain protein [Rhynchospora pubera]
MAVERKTVTVPVLADITGPVPTTPGNTLQYQKARNLSKSDLGGVIFGCNNNNMMECLNENLFGMPKWHYIYIRHIEAGLPLFLFNYSDRQLHGIFEAAGPGLMNIDRYAWSDDSTVRTPFPAQVRICTKTQCLPLSEAQFKKAIEDNYFTDVRFYFELDHAQTQLLFSLFKPINPTYASYRKPLSADLPPTTLRNTEHKILSKQTLDYLNLYNPASAASTPVPDNWIECSKATTSYREVKDNLEVHGTWANMVELDDIHHRINASGGISSRRGFSADYDNYEQGIQLKQFGVSSHSGFDEQIVLNKLRALTMYKEKLVGCVSGNIWNRPPPEAENEVEVPGEPFHNGHLQLPQPNRNDELMQILNELVRQKTELQKKQDDNVREIERLKEIAKQSERKLLQLEGWLDEVEYAVQSEKIIHLIGGFDSLDWLSSFDAFSPSRDMLMPLKRMSSARAYTSVAALGEVIFVIGGSDGNMWFDTVECYNRSTAEWIQCPPLSCSKGSLAGITLGEKIFAIGGGDGENCSSCVEMLDPSLGKWVFGHSMNVKRFATAARELNGAIYTVGGYDGELYLESAERYDPREGYWARLPSMLERRGCLSLAVIDQQLYAVGGFDGGKMVSSVEIFDPRFPSWFPGLPMRKPRGYAASAMINDTIYMMGGLSNRGEITETVECFNQRTGWYTSGFKSLGKRCFFSAVAM